MGYILSQTVYAYLHLLGTAEVAKIPKKTRYVGERSFAVIESVTNRNVNATSN